MQLGAVEELVEVSRGCTGVTQGPARRCPDHPVRRRQRHRLLLSQRAPAACGAAGAQRRCGVDVSAMDTDGLPWRSDVGATCDIRAAAVT